MHLSELLNIGKLLQEQERRREDDRQKLGAALRACGWTTTSSLPGLYWLWSKSFPESKTQWRWEKQGDGRVKAPNPPFAISGTTLEMAAQIEASWQALWDDTRQGPSDHDMELAIHE